MKSVKLELRIKYIVFLFCFLPVLSYSQAKHGQQRLDSLVRELPRLKQDSSGVMLLAYISESYHYDNPDQGLKYAQQALHLAVEVEWDAGLAMSHNAFGKSFMKKGMFPEALKSFYTALKIYEKLGFPKDVGAGYLNIGQVFFYGQSDIFKARQAYQQAMNISEKAGDMRTYSAALDGMASTYAFDGKLETALAYLKKSVALNRTHSTIENQSAGLANLATCYQMMRDYSSALATNFEALRISMAASGFQHEKMGLLGNIGDVYLSIAEDSLPVKPDSLIPSGKPANLQRAIFYLTKALKAPGSDNLGQSSWISEQLTNALRLKGDYKGALEAYVAHVAAKDSLYDTEKTEAMARLETLRAVELKDKDIQIAELEVAKKRNERGFYIAGILLLLGILAVLFRSFRSQKKNNALLSREKKRSDDLLLNILPSEVAEELKNNGESVAKQYEDVSVLFTDFVNFTGTAEKLSAQELVKELNECFTAFDAIVERNGLEKIKTIGDAYLAVCGLPVNDPAHAKKTVQTGIEFSAFINERRKKGNVFEIRIGINSGPVVAGIIGVKKFAYDIWGDTVNTAARMEQNSEAGKVNISQTTYELVKNDFNCNYRGKITAKNKGEMAMYFVDVSEINLKE